MKRAEKREHLLNVATELFNQFGYHGVGIDLIIAESGIAKTTLYRHFQTKEDLIVAVLNRIGERFRKSMRQTVDELAKLPEEKLFHVFDVLENWFKQDNFYGCPFISAMGEYGDRKNPIFQEAVLHKRLMLAYFAELARLANLSDPDSAAEIVNLLYEGAIASAKLSGDATVAQQAKAVTKQLFKDME